MEKNNPIVYSLLDLQVANCPVVLVAEEIANDAGIFAVGAYRIPQNGFCAPQVGVNLCAIVLKIDASRRRHAHDFVLLANGSHRGSQGRVLQLPVRERKHHLMVPQIDGVDMRRVNQHLFPRALLGTLATI